MLYINSIDDLEEWIKNPTEEKPVVLEWFLDWFFMDLLSRGRIGEAMLARNTMIEFTMICEDMTSKNATDRIDNNLDQYSGHSITKWAPAFQGLRRTIAIVNSVRIDDAIGMALFAHRGQTDKSGQAYILHPLRVMMNVETPEEQIIAVLHDVLEDTETTRHDILNKFPLYILHAVEALSHLKGEPREDYLTRVCKNPRAKIVKLADIEDNSDPSRLAKLDSVTAERLRLKYEQSKKFIMEWKRSYAS